MCHLKQIFRLFIVSLTICFVFSATAYCADILGLRLDKRIYEAGECVTLRAKLPNSTTKTAIAIGYYDAKLQKTIDTARLDVEFAPSGDEWVDSKDCIKLVSSQDGSAVDTKDDHLTVINGGMISVAAVSDPAKAKELIEEGTSSDRVFFVDASLVADPKKADSAQVQVDDTMVEKSRAAGQIKETKRFDDGELGIFHVPDAPPVFFGRQRILLRSHRTGTADEFSSHFGGSIKGKLPLPQLADPKVAASGDRGDPELLIAEIAPKEEWAEHLPLLLTLFGNKREFAFSDKGSAALIATYLLGLMAGFDVVYDPLVTPTATPTTNDVNPLGTDQWLPAPDVGIARAATFLDIIDRNAASSVSAAWIGVGFAGPMHYLPADLPPGSAGVNPDFPAIVGEFFCPEFLPCAPVTSARGPNRLTCAGAAGATCDWHDTQSLAVATAVGNNAFGSVGTGGLGRNPAGAPGSLFNVSLVNVGAGYFSHVAQGIGLVALAVRIINISGGFACRPMAVNLCEPFGRGGTIAFCHGAVSVIDVLFPPAGPIGHASCDLGLNAFFEAVGFRFSMPLVTALQTSALTTTIIVSGPEDVTFAGADLGPFDARLVGFIPCVANGVICVGAIGRPDGSPLGCTVAPTLPASAVRAPAAYNPFASGIDIWAPGDCVSGTILPGDGLAFGPRNFPGTSAANPFITGVAAMMLAANPALLPAQIRATLQATSRPLSTLGGGLCDPHPIFGVSPCVGYVDAFAAVTAVAGVGLPGCDGHVVEPDDTAATARNLGVFTDPIPIAPGGVVVVDTAMLPLSIHALPGPTSDVDMFRFALPTFGAATFPTRARLTLPNAAFGTLRLAMNVDGGTAPGAAIGAPTTTGQITASLPAAGSFLLTVDAPMPIATNDNCYGVGTLEVAIMRRPAPDRFEQSANPDRPEPWNRLAEDWSVQHLICPPGSALGRNCADIFDDRVVTPEAWSVWTMKSAPLSIHDEVDVDKFIVTLPDLTRRRPNYSPNVNLPGAPTELFAECESYSRAGISVPGDQNPTNAITTGGVLTIRARPIGKDQGNELSERAMETNGEGVRLYRNQSMSEEFEPRAEPILERHIVCPKRDHDIRELFVTIGERARERGFTMGGYQLELEYKIQVLRGVPESADGFFDKKTVQRALPCLLTPQQPTGLGSNAFGRFNIPGGLFPNCLASVIAPPRFLGNLPWNETGQPDCLADGPGCLEGYFFRWARDGNFKALFSSKMTQSYEIMDLSGKFIAFSESLKSKDDGVFERNAQSLEIESLPAGFYALVIKGQRGPFEFQFSEIPKSVQFVVGDLNGDRMLSTEDRDLLIKEVMAGTGTAPASKLPSADINGDGLINSADVSLMTNALMTNALITTALNTSGTNVR